MTTGSGSLAFHCWIASRTTSPGASVTLASSSSHRFTDFHHEGADLEDNVVIVYRKGRRRALPDAAEIAPSSLVIVAVGTAIPSTWVGCRPHSRPHARTVLEALLRCHGLVFLCCCDL